ncbi:hypothetical protein LSCM1_01558 [Leishmania martiniquensis]|uniref:Fungal lipase-type domain-containing protein n=1 Tax=Leishmania martiniquensis TaxID=1580590 RepID=A0A836KCN3_9TRYP|nr:hypothetical protein LSCM1_01558 [Leishmania martiniquensis]
MKQWSSFAPACIAAVFLAVTALAASASAAGPLAKGGESTISDTSLSAYDYSLAWKALHFSKSAYCELSNVKSWNCGEACTISSSNFEVFDIYDDYWAGTFGYSGIDHEAKHIVAVFRGTSNSANWLHNFDFWSTQYPNTNCQSYCRVHRGFYNAYSSLRTKLIQDLLELHKQHPSYTFLLTGHSLGGAMALLGALDLATGNLLEEGVLDSDAQGYLEALRLLRGPLLELYTFGEPRVGNHAFSTWSKSVLMRQRQYRVTHGRDPVPHLPPQLFGYLHVPQEVWYPKEDSTIHLCQETDDDEDPNCSNSVYAVSVPDHLLYLGICTQCECTAAVMDEIMNYTLPPELYAVLALDHAMISRRHKRR